MYSAHTSVVLHLSLIDGVGPATIQKILIATSGDPDLSVLYKCSKDDFIHRFNLSASLAEKVVSGLKDTVLLDNERRLIEKYKISLYSPLDKEYPELLSQIYSPPPVLYCLGAPLGSGKRFALVGSRKAGDYAQRICKTMVEGLCENGWEIVSGGARGVDSMAHRSTLEVSGKTVVVLGSGLLESYPPENKQLFRDVVHGGGTVLSIFSMQTKPLKANFPIRNRVIAGLSTGCLVVQAAEQSGAHITAQYALEEGRVVCAVPGSIFDELSVGCHQLIAQGAKLVHSVSDILEECNEYVPAENETTSNTSIEGIQHE